MDKATAVTDTKTLWGEDPDKRSLCSASIYLNYSHFRVHSYLYSQFLHFWIRKNNNNRMFPHANSLVELILLELLSEVESTQEGYHKLSISA